MCVNITRRTFSVVYQSVKQTVTQSVRLLHISMQWSCLNRSPLVFVKCLAFRIVLICNWMLVLCCTALCCASKVVTLHDQAALLIDVMVFYSQFWLYFKSLNFENYKVFKIEDSQNILCNQVLRPILFFTIRAFSIALFLCLFFSIADWSCTFVT